MSRSFHTELEIDCDDVADAMGKDEGFCVCVLNVLAEDVGQNLHDWANEVVRREMPEPGVIRLIQALAAAVAERAVQP